ncbi:MAG: hypothetical protein IIC64_15095 [SAR324 cluster bacterium]|nr:hypothetical protein [SAR324 cluster bacterium]
MFNLVRARITTANPDTHSIPAGIQTTMFFMSMISSLHDLLFLLNKPGNSNLSLLQIVMAKSFSPDC